jgi:16S rRNA (cytosine967-C5)-methyltransferase
MPRRLAVAVLSRVITDEAYSHIALDAALSQSALDARDKGLATQLVYGTLTMLAPIDAVLDRLLKKGVRRTDTTLLMIMRVAAYQIMCLDRVPSRAAIHDAVEHARKVDKTSGGLVNAVLRNLDRERESLTWWRQTDRDKKPVRYLAQRYGLPSFFVNRLMQRFGIDGAEREAAALGEGTPPLWARARTEHGQSILAEAERSPMLQSAAKLPGMSPEVREALQSFDLAIQDVGSQLVGKMCDPIKARSVLDACAGLGGKSLHLLDSGAAHVTSVEPHAEKLKLLEHASHDDLARHTSFTGTVQAFSEAHPDARFDLVLVDAPCTGLGVLRRHPEGRLRKKEAEITALAALQKEILITAAKHVRTGGVLVYAVCSFTREEGPKQVEKFLEAHPDFSIESPPPHPAVPDWNEVLDARHTLQTWPGIHDADAFFAARLRRHEELPS